MNDYNLFNLPGPEEISENQAQNTNFVVELRTYEEMLGLIDWKSRTKSFVELTYFLPGKPDVYAYGDIGLLDRDVATMQETGITYCKTREELEQFIL